MHNNFHIDYNLIVKYLSQEADEREVRTVDDWIAQSDLNRTEFFRIKSVWEKTGNYSPAAPANVDPMAAWGKVKKRMEDAQHNEIPRRLGKSRMFVYLSGIAATLLLLVGVWMVFYLPGEKEFVRVADHQIINDTLPDGSTIALNENSNIKYQEVPHQRKVIFSGEAYFDIKEDITKPFIIQMDEAKVLVTGTAFNLKSFPDQDTVVLYMEEGRAYLINADENDSVLVTEGKKGLFIKPTGSLHVLEEGFTNDTYWLTKTLIFKKTALSEVFYLLQETYKAKIKVNDENILNCRLSARYKDASLDHILEQIASVFTLEVSKVDDHFLITGGGCE